MAFFQFHKEQFIPASKDEVWNFISSPGNLKKITPPYMGFDIVTSGLPEKMYEGMIIAYKVSPVAGIKTTWITEITTVVHGEYFVDEQRSGPYRMWHHEHILEEKEGGVLMRDIVSYQPPFSFVGSIANRLFIRRKLEEIFAYRVHALELEFGFTEKEAP